MLAVRELTSADVPMRVSYWVDSDPAFMESMGVDLSKIPSRNDLVEMLSEQLSQSYESKKAYAIIWLLNDNPIGHCNVNKIIFGEEASMHLHLWKSDVRQKGFGNDLVRMSLPYFFKNLKLKKIYSEPYALNPAPNKTLEKVGFELVKEYVTTPGWINFEQPVKRWEMSYEKFVSLN